MRLPSPSARRDGRWAPALSRPTRPSRSRQTRRRSMPSPRACSPPSRKSPRRPSRQRWRHLRVSSMKSTRAATTAWAAAANLPSFPTATTRTARPPPSPSKASRYRTISSHTAKAARPSAFRWTSAVKGWRPPKLLRRACTPACGYTTSTARTDSSKPSGAAGTCAPRTRAFRPRTTAGCACNTDRWTCRPTTPSPSPISPSAHPRPTA